MGICAACAGLSHDKISALQNIHIVNLQQVSTKYPELFGSAFERKTLPYHHGES
jgi:hypothetical protein